MTGTASQSNVVESPPPPLESTAETVPPPEPKNRLYAAFRRGAIAAMVLSCALSLSLNLVDPDLWGHIKYGQELLAEGQLPALATHTFSAPEHPWINHENLAELALAIGYQKLGFIGLLVAKCLLGMGILGGMVLVARWHGVGLLVAWAMAVLIAMNLTAFFPVRPQLASFVCCAVMLICLDRAFARWHRHEIRFLWLGAVVPLMVLWTNAHGGFVAGLCIFGAYLTGRSLEWILFCRRARCPAEPESDSESDPERDPSEAGRRKGPFEHAPSPAWDPESHADTVGPDADPSVPPIRASIPNCPWVLVWRLAAVAVLAGLATFVNPYGYKLSLWLFHSLGQPRPEITEWAAPKPSDPVFIPFVVLVLVAMTALVVNRRRRDWTQIVILILVGLQAAMHLRHIAFFALLCGFWLPPHVARVLKRLRQDRSEKKEDLVLAPWIRYATTVGLAAIVLVQGYVLTVRLTQLPVYRDRYPVDAFAFMVDRQLDGKLVVAFNWAQYAIAAFAPDIQVQFDGRFRTCYPQEVVDSHFDFLLGTHGGRRFRSRNSGGIDGTRAISEGDPDLVLIDRQYAYAVCVMEQESSRPDAPWILLYQDSIAQLWGRRSRFGHPSSPDYMPPEMRLVSDREVTGSIPWPALPPAAADRLLANP